MKRKARPSIIGSQVPSSSVVRSLSEVCPLLLHKAAYCFRLFGRENDHGHEEGFARSSYAPPHLVAWGRGDKKLLWRLSANPNGGFYRV